MTTLSVAADRASPTDWSVRSGSRVSCAPRADRRAETAVADRLLRTHHSLDVQDVATLHRLRRKRGAVTPATMGSWALHQGCADGGSVQDAVRGSFPPQARKRFPNHAEAPDHAAVHPMGQGSRSPMGP